VLVNEVLVPTGNSVYREFIVQFMTLIHAAVWARRTRLDHRLRIGRSYGDYKWTCR
jgi:hypothetical protein